VHAANPITVKKALNLMRKPGRRMICEMVQGSCRYYITGEREIPLITAEKLKKHPQVIAGKDALFPGMDQTWRMGD
jgi:hypothetical protein